jgi:hypothetical protein
MLIFKRSHCIHAAHNTVTLKTSDWSNIIKTLLLQSVITERFRWSRGSVLDFGTLVRGFNPGRIRRIFRAKKSSSRLPSEGKKSRLSHVVLYGM